LITIRPVTENDIVLLTELGRATFTESFSAQNDPVHVQKYLNESHVFEVIKAEFDNPKNHFFLAEYNSEPAGFIKIIFDEDEDHPLLKDKKCMELERIYILKKYQGLGISRKMLDKIAEIAIENHFELIWLGVWEKNLKAITIYEKWGFEKFGSHIFNLGGDLQTDLLMKKACKTADIQK
jgi:diamine N-acetyltransferase